MWQRQSMRKAMIPLTTAGGILKMIVRSLGIDGYRQIQMWTTCAQSDPFRKVQLGGSHQTLGYFEDCTKTMDIYYLTFPFTVHFTKIRQLACMSSAGTIGGPTNTFPIPFPALEFAKAQSDARTRDVLINLIRPGGAQNCAQAWRLYGMPFTVGNMASSAFSASKKEREKWRKWMLCIHFLKEWHIEQGPKVEQSW